MTRAETQLLIISGKGGVGKTTIAAATAVLAAKHRRTLVVSLDRAHSLGDVLQTRLGPKPVKITTQTQLFAMEMDPQVELLQHWGTLQQYTERFLRYLGMDTVAAEEMAVFPGLEELLVLSRLSDLMETHEFDLIIADMAPTASSLRYLSFPDMMDGVLGNLMKWDRRFTRLLKPLEGKLLQMPLPEQAVYGDLQNLTERLSKLRSVLLNPMRTAVRLVMVPETIVLEETKRALAYLNLFGLAVDAIIVNRVWPNDVLTGHFASWGRVQERVMQSAREAFADMPLLTLPFQDDEVLGIEKLEATMTSIYGTADPAEFRKGEPPVKFCQDQEIPTVFVNLPNVMGENLDLGRRNGDLIITVNGWRRSVALPDYFAHRSVTKARLAKGQLEIQFSIHQEEGGMENVRD